MNAKELMDREVYVENFKVGKVKGIHFDDERWKITHLEVELTKEAAKELLGAHTALRNNLAISAAGSPSKSCALSNRIDLKVSKGQLRIYLRPS